MDTYTNKKQTEYKMDTREQENKKYKKQKQINSKNTKNTKYQNIAKQKENNNNNKLKMSVFEGLTTLTRAITR